MQVIFFNTAGGVLVDQDRVLVLRSAQQIGRPADDLKFIPEWMCWDQAIRDLTFDKERKWLLQSLSLLAQRNEETQ